MILFIGTIILIILLLYIDYQVGRWLVHRADKSKIYTSMSEDIKAFRSGDALFNQISKDIEQAQTSIDIQFFIIRNDKISRQIYQQLQRKQEEGVKVRLLTDWVGSFGFRKKWAGSIPVVKANKPKTPFFFYLLQRNHRKTLVIDQDICYFGGFNLGDEYLGKDDKLGKWRDYHVRMTGSATEVFQSLFTMDWMEAKGIKRMPPVPEASKKGDHLNSVQILATEGDILQRETIRLIESAKHSIKIASPYFIPTKKVWNTLICAMDRGVEVTIMIPEKADHLITKAAALPYLKKIHLYGAKVFLYTDGFFHGKVIFIDDLVCDIGTANFDQRSFCLNKECNVIVDKSHPLFEEMIELFDRDIKNSKKLTYTWLKLQPLYMKTLSIISIPLRPFL
ncbi:phospholipase D-like domain-containing protein [Gracilibacillus sp. YIM 98692]|uniref:phospholipase D-like domain-containing protein n=1 Tax=Gracilibacillus sp. YIM 98692 TaxID=2663532 RepID=UPI0013D05843|nr:phospholipase D-like domain-containing protein [Gracilibacillus sp. YIM 98692]